MKVFIAALLLSVTPLLFADPIIPATRLYNWSLAGVEGGIRTNRTTISVVLQPPSSASAINAAVNAAAPDSVVLLAPGDFPLMDRIFLQKDRVTLRGSGIGVTRMKILHNNLYGFLLGGKTYEYDFSQSIAFNISGAVQGAMTVQAPGHNLQVGDFARIDMLEDNVLVDKDGNSGPCNWCGRDGTRPFAQVVKVTARTASSVSFDTPLGWNYTQSPQIIKWSGKVEWFGIENMTITNGINTAGSAADNLFWVAGAANWWIYGCEISGADLRQMWMYDSYRGEIRFNTFGHACGPDFDSTAYAPSHGYGIFLGQGCTLNLIIDNILHRLHYPSANEGAGFANVFGYNYATNIQYGADRVTPQPATGNHGAHPQFGLFEGNLMRSKVLMDSYWGSSSHTMFFRNRIAITPVIGGGIQSQYAIDIDIWKQQQFHTFLANVLGTVGMEKAYFIPDGASVNEGGGQYIFGLGRPDANNTSLGSADPRVAATILLKANWNSVDMGVHAGESVGATNIAPSLIYASKPSFWGTNNWPSIGVDIPGGTVDHPFLPAFYRFTHNGSTAYLGSGGGGGGGTEQPMPPTTTLSFAANPGGASLSVRLTATSPTGALLSPVSGWQVEKQGTGNTWTQTAMIAPGGSLQVTNLGYGTHTWRASALTPIGTGPVSATISTNFAQAVVQATLEAQFRNSPTSNWSTITKVNLPPVPVGGPDTNAEYRGILTISRQQPAQIP